MLHNLNNIGLGYMTLEQPLNTLSRGECQRIKLAKELNKKANIYVLDQPTTGLHLSDVGNILAIINQLVDSGNTVIVIEHNLELIKQADWIVDMGPQGGDLGGNIVLYGTRSYSRASNHTQLSILKSNATQESIANVSYTLLCCQRLVTIY
jgi:excinuclease UvrABC ATPase subunit